MSPLVCHRTWPERKSEAMLTHLKTNPSSPNRVVVLGAGGFVGNAACTKLKAMGVDCLALGRKEVDLLAADAVQTLSGMMQTGDSLLITSAIAPCKNREMLIDNIRMMDVICEVIENAPDLQHVVYISSDAVYSDSPKPLTEDSLASPDNLHGIMHFTREAMLRNVCVGTSLALLRPTLIYGSEDPHNGYGPNRFYRQARSGEDIVLFGEGEERRDHVLIDDVAELICRVLLHQSSGKLNIATGEVVTFRQIAEMIADHVKPRVAVKGSPRQGAMPHGGYRAFDISACTSAFTDFEYTPFERGLKILS